MLASTRKLVNELTAPTVPPLLLEWVSVAILCLLFIGFPMEPVDFAVYYEAAQAWPDPYSLPLTKLGPYGVELYYIYTPLGALLVAPLALVPYPVASALIRIITVIGLHLLAGRTFWKTAAIIAAPTTILLAYGNIDTVAALGLLLPGSAATLLLLAKPQVAILALPLIARRDGWRAFLPAAAVLALLLPQWLEWLARARAAPANPFSVSLFPWSLPVAALMMWFAWKRRNLHLAALATPFATPYLTLATLPIMAALLFRHWPRLGWVTWVGAWAYVLLRWQ
jgi:hypothetical protein